MIRKGDVIENPMTGERLRFLETSSETNGESVLVECTVQPNGFVAAAHLHPKQTERFEIESGVVAFKLDGKELVAHRGDTVIVPAGISHKFWNAGETESTSSARSSPRSSSSACSRRCSVSRPTARRTGRACPIRCASP